MVIFPSLPSPMNGRTYTVKHSYPAISMIKHFNQLEGLITYAFNLYFGPFRLS